jgi:15-cis-phytoene desaturase
MGRIGGTTIQRFDTVVIGGGLAGITCAVALSERGQRVALLEAGAILGGRASSRIDPITGDPIAVGPHVLFSEYTNMLKLLRTLGTEREVVWDRDRFITNVFGRREVVMRMSPLPAPFHFVPSLVADPTLRNRDWLSNAGATLFALSLSDDDLRWLDDVPAIDILRRLGVSEAYLTRFWRFVSLAIMNVEIEECSAAALLRGYRRLIGKGGYRVGFPKGGLGALFAPAAERLLRERGSTVLLDASATSIAEGRVSTAAGHELRAATIVVALPPHALDTLLPAEWKTGELATLAAFRPASYASVYLWFDRKLTMRRFWSRGWAPGDLNLDFYDFSNIDGGATSLIGSNIIGAHRIGALSDDEIVARTIAELAEYLPEAAEARVRHRVVNRIPMAIHAPLVGSERLRPTNVTPRAGLVLAGDWMQTGMPASMESACYSGYRAAEAVLGIRGLAVRHRELGPLAAILGRAVRWARAAKLRE